MTSAVQELIKKRVITPPKWLYENLTYECIMGSFAYGVSSDTSDCDVYGFCIPPRGIVFPHEQGIIFGFDQQVERFDQYQQAHVQTEEKSYDFSIFNIVKYFRLCADGNPNMVDSLFVPINCILHTTTVGTMVRDYRRLFLSKKVWHTCKGYAYQQMMKIKNQRNSSNPKRQDLIQKFGYDTKFAYHVVRLLNQAEQMLAEGDLDLQLSREQLKSIRRGEWKLSDIEDYFTRKEKQLEELYVSSTALPYKTRETEIKQLLVDCLEHHYGSLGAVYQSVDKKDQALKDIKKILDEVL